MFQAFKDEIWRYYSLHKRTFFWREKINPYYVCISEIMLQQTQTHRVAQKFEDFIRQFPDFAALAQAPFAQVLKAWQGLGYNRRALYVHKIAQKVMDEHKGLLPDNPEILETFPGIGKNTAGSICAFAYNKPIVFIETNIRTVFIHFFFQQYTKIHDKELLLLIEQTVDTENPREWYYALMDYGVMLKKSLPNPSRQSAHHAKQSTFEGSDRQIRGMILKLLTERQAISVFDLYAFIDREEIRINKALDELRAEGFVKISNSLIQIT